MSASASSVVASHARPAPRPHRRARRRRARRRARRAPRRVAASPAGSRRHERRLEVVERGRGSVAERDRLLDLEVERHAAVLDAAAVLDRDEPQEALELAGAPRELLVRERRGAEARERALDAREPAPPGDAPRAAAAATRSNDAVSASRRAAPCCARYTGARIGQ